MSKAPLNELVQNLRRTVEAYRLDALPDAELLERFRRTTDPVAFEAIVRRHGDRVLAACHKVLPDPADVEDAFQATFLVLLREARTIRKRESLGGWLYGVAHRTALQARRRATRRADVEARKPTRTSEEAPDLSWREACAVLHEELDRLPDTYRLPLLLCYLEGKSRDEAARQLGVKTEVLRGRLERGRVRLRGRLTRRGVALSAGLLAAAANSVTAGVPPEHLLRATLKAATTGNVPAAIAALVHGASPPMTLGKFKLAAAALLAVGLISGGLGLRLHGTPPAKANETRPAKAARRPAPAKEAAAVAADRDKPADADGKPVAVSGKVVGPDGKPVKAKLFVFDSEEWKAAPQAETKGDGAFAFAVPPLAGGRSYRYLVATAPELGLGCDWVGVAAADAPLRDAVLKLPKDVPIKGRVVDLEGKPVAGATVSVSDLETGKDDTLDEFVRLWSKDRDKQQQAVGALHGKRLFAKKATAGYFTTTTDADGRFTLAGIGRDRCPQLTVRAKGLAAQVCLVPIRPDFKPAEGGITGSPVLGPDFTLPLAPSKTVTGVVRDAATKKPLAGVRVLGQVDQRDDFRPGWLILPDVEAVTDAEGRYTLDGLPRTKKYVLAASPKAGEGPVHGFATCGDDKPERAAVTADFDLPRGAVLTGRITDQKTGKPVRGYVFYRPLWSNKWVDEHPVYDGPGIAPWAADEHGWTDADGRFKVTAVPGPGLLHVQVLGHDGEREYTNARLAPEDDTDEIVHKNSGIPGMFKARGQGGMFGPRNLNAYRVLRIPADAKTFTADATVDPGVTRVVKIVDADGKPVAGTWVMNARPYGGTSKPLDGAECIVTALDPAAPRRLYAQHDEKKLGGFLTLDGKETGPAVLKLEPTATVTGRVVDRDGAPVKEARVSPSYDDPEIGIQFNTRDHYDTRPVLTDADGKFTLTNIPAGLAVRFGATPKGGGNLGHTTVKQTLKPGETLDLGVWKPK
jgi:RNA polymerase sigma factor (sigma-70 family)